MTRGLFWIGLLAAALAAVWLLLTVSPSPVPPSEVRFEAQGPWIIGDSENAFAYAGENVRTIEGTVTLRIDPDTEDGLLEIALPPDEALTALLEGAIPERSVTFSMRLKQADNIWIDQSVHGDSGVGESRLPGTYAFYAGSGRFELLIDGVRQPTEWEGFWSYGHAIRQLDGSIRDQGLVFSPLLRNRSRFSDSDRTEFTLLMYSSPDSGDVVLHLVFPNVRMIAAGSL